MQQVTEKDFNESLPIICINHATLHVQELDLPNQIIHAQADGEWTIELKDSVERWLSRQAADAYGEKEAFKPFLAMGGNTIIRILHAWQHTVFKIVACDILVNPQIREYDDRYPPGDIGLLLEWVEPYRHRLVTEWPVERN